MNPSLPVSRCLARILVVAFAAAATLGAQAAILSQTRTTANTVTPGGNWTQENNAASINGVCALGDGATTTSLTLTSWGFAIPVGSTVLGVSVRSVSSFNDVSTQDQMRLVKAGAPVGTAKALNGPGSINIPNCGNPIGGAQGLTVGGTSDLWGTTLTVAEVNASGFGVFYDNDFTNTAVDGVAITVTYDDNVVVTFTVTPSAGANGIILPNTPQSVVSGATAFFNVTPTNGYAPSVGGTCGGTLIGPISYQTNAITANCTVVASFVALDPAADTDGDGIPNGVEVAEGRNALFKDNDVFFNNRLFAMQQYRDFLGREGDAGGITFYTNLLTSGSAVRGNVIESFFNSPEFSGTVSPVVRLYFAFFNRVPDYAGLQFQVNAYRTGTPLPAIANSFAASPEFLATYGALTNSQYVALLYTNVLGRAASQPEIDFHVARLNAGVTRGEVMLGFSESPEFIAAIAHEVYVTMMYVGMLRRAPEPAGFVFWLNYLDGGNPGLALILGFLNAPEYSLRFLLPPPG